MPYPCPHDSPDYTWEELNMTIADLMIEIVTCSVQHDLGYGEMSRATHVLIEERVMACLEGKYDFEWFKEHHKNAMRAIHDAVSNKRYTHLPRHIENREDK